MTETVTVPVEPTEEMLEAFNHIAKWLASNEGTAYAVQAAAEKAIGEPYWKAMLAARPQDELGELVVAYAEAIEDIAGWGAYASDYFQEKHDLAGCLANHNAILAKHK